MPAPPSISGIQEHELSHGGAYQFLSDSDGGITLINTSFPFGFTTGVNQECAIKGTLQVGVTSAHALSCAGDVIAFASDARLKMNITDIDHPLEKLNKLRGVYYNWNKKSIDVGFNTTISQEPEIGMIAQELEEVIPTAVKRAPFDHKGNRSIYNDKHVRIDGEDSPYKTIQLEKVVPLLIECIKEQQVQINELKLKMESK
jgi:hypothetical protein